MGSRASPARTHMLLLHSGAQIAGDSTAPPPQSHATLPRCRVGGRTLPRDLIRPASWCQTAFWQWGLEQRIFDDFQPCLTARQEYLLTADKTNMKYIYILSRQKTSSPLSLAAKTNPIDEGYKGMALAQAGLS